MTWWSVLIVVGWLLLWWRRRKHLRGTREWNGDLGRRNEPRGGF